MIPTEWKEAVVANAGTESAEVDLGGYYRYVTVLIPTITSSVMGVKIARESGGTFYPLHHNDGVTVLRVADTTTAATTSLATIFEIGGAQFLKLYCAAQNSGAITCYVRGFN